MSETLYRKYRPQKFSDVIGQQHIVQTLSNAIEHKRIGHAYIFTGPRGTGKTTMARLFAKAVNCEIEKDPEPCLECNSCKNISDGKSLDIIEIDAASHTGVDNIRELKETVKLPPTQTKYKIYIIDEVHMLSIGAFNALLKTLEEPPAHVIFILATTTIHKVPDTILSRCQRFDFARLPLESISKKLSIIAKSEGIKIDKNSLGMIALAAEGGMRDAESLLSQVISLEDKNITSKEVEDILGTADHQTIEDMTKHISSKDTSAALALVNKLTEDGYDLEVFTKSLLNYFRQLMLLSINPNLSKNLSYELTTEQTNKLGEFSKKIELSEILKTIDNLVENQSKIKSSFIPQLPLEIAIIKSINTDQIMESIPQKKNPVRKSAFTKILKNKPVIEEEINEDNKEAPTLAESEDGDPTMESVGQKQPENIPTENSDQEISINNVRENWKKLLEDIRPYNHSLNALLSNCQPVKIEENCIIIAAKYNFHKDRLNEGANKLTVEKVLDNILGSKIKISAINEEEAGIKIKTPGSKQQADEKPKENGNLLDDAMKIMGGKVVDDK